MLDERRKAAWLAAKIAAHVTELTGTPEGERNDLLNKLAYELGGYVAGEGLDEQLVHDQLRTAALAAGLDERGTENTLRSALTKGRAKPLRIELEDRALAEVTPELDADAYTAFWSARRELQHVFDYARARRVSPWAALGCTLVHVVAATEPTLVLPPLIGGYASLNYFIGLVGASGSGKGGAERVAREAIMFPHVGTATVGSGEGIGHSYKRRERGVLVDVTKQMIFSVPEVDTLAAVAARQGATLLPELRRAWSGEALGFAYADPTKRLPIAEHDYRLCLVLGIQPARAHVLLDDTEGGTPQRFVWLPSTDRNAPDVAPAAPDPISWEPPRVDMRRDLAFGRKAMAVCELARKTIDDAHLDRTRGHADALDGHLLLTHLKTAAALALLDRRLDVSVEDWQLAETVMTVSMRTRSIVTDRLSGVRREENRARAEGDAERSLIVGERLAEAAEQRTGRRIMAYLAAHGTTTQGVLRRAVRHSDREHFEQAAELLQRAGQISVETDEKGVIRYALD